MSELVLYEVKDRIGYITLNRPEKRNALSFELVKQLKSVFNLAEHDPSCKIMVLQGAGEAFCAGADLAYIQQLQQFSEEENRMDSKNLMELFLMINQSAKIVIAKVKGPALAGGCGLATVCDFGMATPESTFGYTEARIGFVPAMVMVFLLRKVSEKTAREILLSAEVFSAEKALQHQLINQVIEASAIDDITHQFATRLALTTSSQSVAMIKQMIPAVTDLPFKEGLEYAAAMNVLARKNDDCKKGIAAFLAKEKLKW